MKKSGIFIFTRDRPQTLKVTLNSISGTEYQIYVIDDSTNEENQIETQLLLSGENQHYLGKQAFNEFIHSTKVNTPQFSFLLRLLGNKEWNLGFARNFALLYSKSLSFENVLFMDDDIKVSSLDIVDVLFQGLRTYKFTGAHISGLVDDSVLGHIATGLDIHNERMLSGGFMAFNPNRISDYFLNIYNEDWIWLFMQLKGENYLQTGEVLQELKNPLAEFEHKIIFQEFGEIVLDGILDLYDGAPYDTLKDATFWDRILNEREEYLNKLIGASTKGGFKDYSEIIKYAQMISRHFTRFDFKTLFEKYFNNRNAFQKLFNSL